MFMFHRWLYFVIDITDLYVLHNFLLVKEI
jgi:hypothetical protein